MIKNHDDTKTREMVESISALFRKLEKLIKNLSHDEAHVLTINESFELLNNYEKNVPLKYKRFFIIHFDDLVVAFQNKIIFNTVQTITNQNKMDSTGLLDSIRFAFRSLEILLANYCGDGKKGLIINAFVESLDKYKDIVPQKYQKAFLRHYDHLKVNLTKKSILPESVPAIRPVSCSLPEKRSDLKSSVRTKKDPTIRPSSCMQPEPRSYLKGLATKPVRESRWTSERDYRYFKKTTLEKTPDPFLAKRLRRI